MTRADTQAIADAGLRAEVFSTADLSGAAVMRAGATFNVDWQDGAPADGVPADGVGVRWSGGVVPRRSALHTFVVSARGGARLWVQRRAADRQRQGQRCCRQFRPPEARRR